MGVPAASMVEQVCCDRCQAVLFRHENCQDIVNMKCKNCNGSGLIPFKRKDMVQSWGILGYSVSAVKMNLPIYRELALKILISR